MLELVQSYRVHQQSLPHKLSAITAMQNEAESIKE